MNSGRWIRILVRDLEVEGGGGWQQRLFSIETRGWLKRQDGKRGSLCGYAGVGKLIGPDLWADNTRFEKIDGEECVLTTNKCEFGIGLAKKNWQIRAKWLISGG